MQKDLFAGIAAELENAERSRLAEKEGRARVCARRAAGMAARAFLTRHGVQTRGSAYTALQALTEFPGLAPNLRTAAIHLTTRVNETFALPEDIDLIVEARKLIEGLQ